MRMRPPAQPQAAREAPGVATATSSCCCGCCPHGGCVSVSVRDVGSGGGETRQRQQNTHTHTTIIADSIEIGEPQRILISGGSSCTYAPWTHKPHTITHTGGGTTTRPMAKEEEGPPASLRAARADGLERFYDVVIVGTGLVEAMLSAYVRARVCVGWWGFKLFTLRIFINSNSTMLHAGPWPRSARACCTSKR